MKEKLDTVRIDSMAYGGSGVGRIEGKVVFVPLTAVGDLATFRPIREKKGYLEGELVDLIEPSLLRREPPCRHFGECGGCSWQHIPYEEQAKAKEDIFRETIMRFGEVKGDNILSLIPATSEWQYRNRAQFKAIFAEGRLQIGFYRRKSHFVVDIEECSLMSPLINKTMTWLKSALADAPFRDRMSQVDISVDESDKVASATIHLISRPSKKEFQFASSLSACDGLDGLYFKSGRKSGVTKIISREGGFLNYSLPSAGKEVNISFSQGGFTQVNFEQNRQLVSEVLNICSQDPPGNVLDIYCGIGNFSVPLAFICKELLGIDGYEGAIKDARQNAEAASLSNCSFIAGDAASKLKKIPLDRYDMALIDPPRQGAASVVKMLADARVPKIIYVSCNPMTLARDLKLLSNKGYKVKSSRPFDLFPQTYHIESISVAEISS